MTLPDKTDIIVIGAGVMGASIAFNLAKSSDKRVLVLDQHGPLGGMSGRTFGQVRMHYSNALTLEMAHFGMKYVANWEAEVGVGASGYVPMGYLLIVVENQLAPCERNIELAGSLGIETRMVTPAEIAEIEPAINASGLSGGAWDPAGGYIDINRMTLGWLEAARGAGDVSLAKARVTGLETTNGAITGVVTDQRAIAAEQVIVAAGPWSRDLLTPIGLDAPLEARRLETMYLSLPPGAPNVRTCVTDGQSNIVIRPDMGATVLAAAYPPQMDLVDDPLDPPPEGAADAHHARCEAAFAERFPGLQGAKPICTVSGSYDITPDWHPILGPAPNIEGLHLAFGFSGHGLKLSPAVGQVIAETALGKPPLFDIRPLRYERFADDDQMFLAYGPGGRA